MLQGFRLADALERVVSQDVVDQEVDPLERWPVLAFDISTAEPRFEVIVNLGLVEVHALDEAGQVAVSFTGCVWR